MRPSQKLNLILHQQAISLTLPVIHYQNLAYNFASAKL